VDTVPTAAPDPAPRPRYPGLREAFGVWCRVAALSFGGPAGQIAVMQRILVDEKRWISQGRFLHALNYCMLLPGPEAQQLATYIGWLLHRVRGGLIAGTLFVLPGFLSILALSILYAGYRDLAWVEGVFYGLKPAVVAIVVEAVLRVGRRALDGPEKVAIAAAAFAAIFFLQVPFPLIVVGAAAVGLVLGRAGRGRGSQPTAPEAANGTPVGDALAERQRPSWRRSLLVGGVALAAWWLPLAGLGAVFGGDSVFVQEGLFFSKAALVTFGGAYAVLAYVAQQAVESYAWLQPGEMLDGLGMAETTPGPLIQVVQFVGFMGAYREPGALSPLAAGILGSAVTTWVTFVPCFLWIFLGAPYVEWLRGWRALNSALSAITAAVVGVILNLAIWFALHTLFGVVVEIEGPLGRLMVPRWSTLDVPALLITVGAFAALLWWRLGLLTTLGLAVVAGLVVRLLL
jgi:chromate transporter